MALFEKRLDGDIDKVAVAIDRIRFAYSIAVKKGLGALYVAFSGGKDSICIAKLCEIAGVPYELNYNITGIDPPELVYYIRDFYPQCKMNIYAKSMWQLIVMKHMPPTRLMRYCCAGLKERGGVNRMCITGVRWAESVRRANTRFEFENQGKKAMKDKAKAREFLFNDNNEGRQHFENCTIKNKLVVNPIIDWEDDDVWEFIRTNKMPYCCLYDMGYKRIGCIGCPMAPLAQRIKEFEQYPGYKKLYIQAFDKMLLNMSNKTNWQSGEDVFNWWLYGKEDDEILPLLALAEVAS